MNEKEMNDLKSKDSLKTNMPKNKAIVGDKY